MKRRLFNLAAALSLAVLAGCVQVSTGLYEIHGRRFDRVVGSSGSGKPVEVGVSSAVVVRRELGQPLVEYEADSTDIFEAVPQYRRTLVLWPAALINQKQPGDPRILVRLDYDEHKVLQQHRSTATKGPVIRFAVPADVHRAWPDLRDRKPVAFGK